MEAWMHPGDHPPVPQPDPEVAELLRLAAGGDGDVWGELVDRYGGVVLAAARAQGLSDSDVADVAWLTWTSAVEYVDRLTDPERFGAWLTAVAREESRRVAHTAARRIGGDDDGGVPAAVVRAYDRVPERERALIELLQREPSTRLDPSADAA
jgi:DNA-directed RNA polymerase specialized sigma24 family protein